MVEEKGSVEGVEVRNVIRIDSCNVVPKVLFIFSAFPMRSVVFLCHLDLHRILRDDFAD